MDSARGRCGPLIRSESYAQGKGNTILNGANHDAAPRRPTLEIVRGGERMVLELLLAKTVLGSATEADLYLAMPGIAPQHARFEREGERCYVIGLDPAYPVFVQGVERREWLLRDGDEVRLGTLNATFRWAEALVKAAPAIPPTVAATPSTVAATPVVVPVARPVAPSAPLAPSPPRERREVVQAGWPWPAKAFLLLLIATAIGGIWLRSRGAPPDELPRASEAFKSTEGLDPFFYYAIYPISERLDAYPAAARLVIERCQILLRECGDPRTRIFAEEALEKARRAVSGSTWTFDEMRYATEQAPTGGRSEDYFRAEKRSILHAFLASNPGAADRFVAEAKLKQLDR